jgi:hypothetical protein
VPRSSVHVDVVPSLPHTDSGLAPKLAHGEGWQLAARQARCAALSAAPYSVT